MTRPPFTFDKNTLGSNEILVLFAKRPSIGRRWHGEALGNCTGFQGLVIRTIKEPPHEAALWLSERRNGSLSAPRCVLLSAPPLLSHEAARLCLAPFGNWPTGDVSVRRKRMEFNVEAPAVLVGVGQAEADPGAATFTRCAVRAMRRLQLLCLCRHGWFPFEPMSQCPAWAGAKGRNGMAPDREECGSGDVGLYERYAWSANCQMALLAGHHDRG